MPFCSRCNTNNFADNRNRWRDGLHRRYTTNSEHNRSLLKQRHYRIDKNGFYNYRAHRCQNFCSMLRNAIDAHSMHPEHTPLYSRNKTNNYSGNRHSPRDGCCRQDMPNNGRSSHLLRSPDHTTGSTNCLLDTSHRNYELYRNRNTASCVHTFRPPRKFFYKRCNIAVYVDMSHPNDTL